MKRTSKLKGALALLLTVALTLGGFSVFASAVSAEATAFISAVDALEAKSELAEKQTALEAADTALEAYLAVDGNAKNDSAISAKYAKLVEIKNDMFIEYVGYASAAHTEEDYPTTRENLDLATAIIDSLSTDELTDSSKTYKITYQNILEDLREPEELSANYLERAEQAKNAATFAEAKKAYDAAKQIEKNLSLDGYPGIEDAAKTLKEVQAYLSRCTIAASSFLIAVDNVYMNDNFFDGIEEAYDAYEALVDTTVTGVPEAKSNLDAIVSSHNNGATRGNAIANDLNAMVYGLILGTGESASGNFFVDWANKTFG